MDEYISREEVVKEIKSRIFDADDAWESGYNTAMEGIMEWIEHMPSADVQPVKQDTELSSILQDYGINDTDTLRYILDQSQKIIVDITGGQMSYLTYPAETVIACADDNYCKCYEESMNHGRWELITQNKFTGTKTLRCTYCKNYFVVRDDTLNAGRGDANFCPNCGCKQDMDGDSE